MINHQNNQASNQSDSHNHLSLLTHTAYAAGLVAVCACIVFVTPQVIALGDTFGARATEAATATTTVETVTPEQSKNKLPGDATYSTVISPELIGTNPIATETNQAPQVFYADSTKIQAKAVLVKNLTSGQVLYAKNSNKRLPLASLTKLMTAVTVNEIVKNWKVVPEKIQLSADGAGLTKADRAVKSGGYMKLNDLVAYMLLTSSNFAAYSLSEHLIPFDSFIAYMNFTGKNLGLTNSNFINASGLTEVNSKKQSFNSEGTASDITKILETIVSSYPKLAKATQVQSATVTSSNGEKITIENPNKLLGQLDNIIVGKTGFTDDAGGNLAIVFMKDNQYYAITVLGSTIDGRFEDIAYLASQI